jgi:restriction system protein
MEAPGAVSDRPPCRIAYSYGLVTLWGIHNDRPELGLHAGGFVSVGWDRLGDLRAVGADRDSLKSALAAAYPDAKPRAIPVWAGTLARFAAEIEPGDLVVHPHRPDRTLSFARVTGAYRYEADAPTHRHRRDVDWLLTGVPRSEFPQPALYELGASITVFRVRSHADEFEAWLAGAVEL